MNHDLSLPFSWYLDITPNRMFSLGEYPIQGKDGVQLCQEHGMQLEMKEVVLFDKEATEDNPPDHCWVRAIVRENIVTLIDIEVMIRTIENIKR